jgi:hypothetical protein
MKSLYQQALRGRQAKMGIRHNRRLMRATIEFPAAHCRAVSLDLWPVARMVGKLRSCPTVSYPPTAAA